MADEGSATGTTSNESSPTMAFGRSEDRRKRRWTCPADEAIAAYVDGTLREGTKRRLEIHLAECEWCRSITADVVKLQRDLDLPVPPSKAANRILAVSPRVPTDFRWIWVPAAAMVLIVFMAVM